MLWWDLEVRERGHVGMKEVDLNKTRRLPEGMSFYAKDLLTIAC